MKLKLTVYGALCETSEFKINGVEADHADFREHYDRDRDNAEDYACADMRFTAHDAIKKDVLKKYKISKDEYHKVCSKLEDLLSFGNCDYCV